MNEITCSDIKLTVKYINRYLHIIFNTKESSNAEFGKRGFNPSHFSIVPSSSGKGSNFKTDVTTLEFVVCNTLK